MLSLYRDIVKSGFISYLIAVIFFSIMLTFAYFTNENKDDVLKCGLGLSIFTTTVYALLPLLFTFIRGCLIIKDDTDLRRRQSNEESKTNAIIWMLAHNIR